mmetsp:Transcript_6763/g.11358  ORF Transcript_6763/g.11358 Transcript_6763/m.11358 type:complete len:428 (+) Transcript_6763:161-1444(+)
MNIRSSNHASNRPALSKTIKPFITSAKTVPSYSISTQSAAATAPLIADATTFKAPQTWPDLLKAPQTPSYQQFQVESIDLISREDYVIKGDMMKGSTSSAPIRSVSTSKGVQFGASSKFNHGLTRLDGFGAAPGLNPNLLSSSRQRVNVRARKTVMKALARDDMNLGESSPQFKVEQLAAGDAKSVGSDFQDKEFSAASGEGKRADGGAVSVETQKSMVQKSVTNTVKTAKELMAEKGIKGGGPLSRKLIGEMLVENVREERPAVDLPPLAPFGNTKFWDFKIFPRIQKSLEEMNEKDKVVLGLVAGIHGMCLAAPFTYTPEAFELCILGYILTAMGITTSYHRQLTHKSFETSKTMEYFLSIFGLLAVQGDPIEWVSAHRHHHAYCDKEVDPHSPFDGFFWSHMGWLFDSSANKLLFDTKNVKDLK